MKLAVELEFPAEEAATAIQWLQSVPEGIRIRLLNRATIMALEALTPSIEQLTAQFKQADEALTNDDLQ